MYILEKHFWSYFFIFFSLGFFHILKFDNSKISKEDFNNLNFNYSEISKEDFNNLTFNNSEINDTTFVLLSSYSKDFVYDMKYATQDNFLKQKVYDCGDCYLRLNTVKSLIKANEEFISKGYRIKIFDCYRPLDIQKKMWEIVPNPAYVANPIHGSIHNKGGAVDITLVDSNGNELKMGTPFDHFGKKSSHNYNKFSKTIINNRMFLKSVMSNNNFNAIDSEWWHYNFNECKSYKISNFKWECN